MGLAGLALRVGTIAGFAASITRILAESGRAARRRLRLSPPMVRRDASYALGAGMPGSVRGRRGRRRDCGDTGVRKGKRTSRLLRTSSARSATSARTSGASIGSAAAWSAGRSLGSARRIRTADSRPICCSPARRPAAARCTRSFACRYVGRRRRGDRLTDAGQPIGILRPHRCELIAGSRAQPGTAGSKPNQSGPPGRPDSLPDGWI